MRRLFILGSAVMLFQTVFGQKQKLGFNLIVGQTYYQIMKSSMNVGPKGQRALFHFTSGSKMGFKVTGLKDSIYDISASFQQLEMSTQFGFGSGISFNSDKKDENDTISNVLKAMIDKPFVVKMTRLGRIIEVKNMDSNFKVALDKFPELSWEQKEQFKGQFMKEFGENTFKSNFEMVTAIYSDRPVEKGDNWIININADSNKADTLITTYEFKDKAENYILITGNGNNEALNTDGQTQMNGMPMKYNLADSINSSLQVDSKTGWIIEGKINELTSESSEIKDNPKMPGGKKTAMSVSKEMTFSSK